MSSPPFKLPRDRFARTVQKKRRNHAPEPSPVEPTHEEPEPEPEPVQEPPAAREPPPPAPKAEPVTSPPPRHVEAPPAAPKAAPASTKPSAPPPVSDKPSGGSFRDRIAAFNKAAPPVAPFKPGGLSSGGSNNFIKKPFVPPPPSKNAYVPPPREPVPQKIYRREEDPEIAAKETENQELAERAGLAPTSNGDDGGEQPKPTNAAQKKEKPKRPAKKRTDSHGHTDVADDADGASLERRDTEEAIAKPSMDSVREEQTAPRRRKSSSRAPVTPGLHPRKSFGDGNDADMSGAGDTTEEPEEMSTGRDDSDEKPRRPLSRMPTAPTREPDVGEEDGAAEEPDDEGDQDEGEEEDDIDPEVRRKEELRARMAKMSGGMGMHGMFGPPGGMPMPGPAPPKKKKSISAGDKRSGEYGIEDAPSPSTRAPPVPMIPMPGMSRVRSPDEIDRQLEHDDDHTPISTSRPANELPDVEDVVPPRDRGAPPPVPSQETGGRPAPPPVPKEARPAAPPPSMTISPSAGSESDDEMSSRDQKSVVTPRAEAPRAPARPEPQQLSPRSPGTKRVSYFGSDEPSPTSPSSQGSNNKRASRVPPIPGAPIVSSSQNRAPPPPPPNAPLSRSSTGDQRVLPSPRSAPKEESEEEVTEYEGDYDTDIASAVPHKDALKAHARDSSFEDTSSLRSPVVSPPSAPPPLPAASAPRAGPPPLPSQPPPNARQSSEMPRAAPPPPPPAAKLLAPWEQDDSEYDPYKYTAPKPVAIPSMPSPRMERNEDDLYSASPPRQTFAPPPQDRQVPQPPPRDAVPGSSHRGPPRQSLEVQRTANPARRSVELGRMSMDSGYVANDVDLGRSSYWWTQPRGIPPVFQSRKDYLFEMEESSAKRGSKTIVTKELYFLFLDYSQTIVAAEFDAQDPADVNLEQKHEPPPSRLRQDQLEQAHEQFGRRISEAVASKKDTVVGDGTPHGLIQELLKPFSNALRPVGARAYGAIVYGNLANASTQQNDEIRPGDIITFRNTKFQGKHGPMHAKYSMEVGKPDHVGIVSEWDGTKKKVRAWEQARESKKVKLESFKLDDLRSGEVKIWRIMPRSWVGWQGQN
ncbi:hypothetical protein G7Y89_g5862 [Cudoniella acicularis]|uniref:BBC1/AIM3 cysteine proteinase-fold domain-containing protein n=1 Tax=Cudoniella acicularis TaxID=354080 RepID=A0A8H4RNW1_9HELO|nr:hypothetical protein G7Y89_g5862 [Cudoniella acicularis]